jgi:hypothetical protein
MVVEQANGGTSATSAAVFRRAGLNAGTILVTSSGLTTGQACGLVASSSNILFTGCEL